MKVYAVGGAVRDEAMGEPAKDRDWVVVGSSPEEMLRLGYLPVGRDFPVFLHPESKEEYALARCEKKVAPGHQGFAFQADPSVTLEEDLSRRDLTVNAMARELDANGDPTGAVIDPFGGLRDLKGKTFRHVSEAFAEDPLRVLRLARFSSRWPAFSIAPETIALSRSIVASGELATLSAERVWKEVSRGLMAARPSRMIAALIGTGALGAIAPELARAQPEQIERIGALCDAAAQAQLPLSVRFAAFSGAAEESAALAGAHAALGERWRVPSECAELAALFSRERALWGRLAEASAGEVAGIVQRSDALRRPERLREALGLAKALASAHGEEALLAAERGERRALAATSAARGVDAGAIARACAGGSEAIRAAVQAARDEAVRQALAEGEEAPARRVRAGGPR
jgi:tRNA nucleotidyltransferase (CCA-adding enzyme)